MFPSFILLLLHLLLPCCSLILLLPVGCTLSNTTTITNTTPKNETDLFALLEFKRGITDDPLRVMDSWNDSIHFCKWKGITCDPSSNETVLSVRLDNQKLVGSLSPSIGNFTSLRAFDIRSNYFHGQIPQEIGRLFKLELLFLSSNSFTGEIPINLTHCPNLKILDLGTNDLVGNIPDQLSSLTKLTVLDVNSNNLTGKIPPWIGNLSLIFGLNLLRNNLHGEIPKELGRLSKLQIFQVSSNKLYGTIPPSLYNISSITVFSVAVSHLQGRLPPDLGLTLPKLEFFAGGGNNFTGTIPVSLSNISGLQILDLPDNHLSGPLPLNLGRLKNLTTLRFDGNQISSEETGGLDVFITSLTNCTSLEVLSFDSNLLIGKFPESIGNLSTHLKQLALGNNRISGSIPSGIENLVNLTLLYLNRNFLTGSIPFGIGKLTKLGKLSLARNKLSGPIPSSIGNLSILNELYLGNNSLEGSIPSSLGSCQNLLLLSLSYNKLNGTLPKQIFNLSTISISFAIDHNSLSGSLPSDVGNLKNLAEMNLSKNKFSGEIPSNLDKCIIMERLYLDGNFFHGVIPASLNALRGLQVLDLSSNNLSGKIPEYLEKLPNLNYINLSSNDLEGEVPKQGVFADPSRISVLGNKRLCGGISKLQLPVCSIKSAQKSQKHLPLRVKILIGIGVLFVVLSSSLATYCWIRNSRRRTRSSSSTPEDWKSSISFAQLFRSTNGFSMDNLIGVGSFGSVYKAVLGENGPTVAVKVLNLEQTGASKSFTAECNALRNIRHRNLVKVLTVCSSVNSEGSDFKALVFELMSNGNLDQWLHPQSNNQGQFKSLNLSQRLNMAIDVASALEYLHDHSQTPIAHCDLKPSNVLLDDDMTAHVTDFGLARFLFETTNPSSTSLSVGLKGSIGYIPPEYGMGGEVSIYGDIYSYGILLLEMFTGKRPTDEMFKDGSSLYNFARMGLPDRVEEIIDPLLLLAEQEHEGEDENRQSRIGSRMHECLVSMIRIGISCSTASPSDRMMMRDVVSKMNVIRNSFRETLGLRRRAR